MNVLLAFTEDSELGVSEIAHELNLPKSAVHRMLTSLLSTGFIEKSEPTGRYRLGAKAVEFGLAALGTPGIRESVLPVMEELSRDTQETVTLSARIGGERVYVGQIEGPTTVRMKVNIGARYPLYAGASGRAILSFLPHGERNAYLTVTTLAALTRETIVTRDELESEIRSVRRRGYAVSRGERDPWAAAVAAPVLTSRGRVIESLSVCGPRQRFDPRHVRECGDAVRRAAELLSSQTGRW